MSIINNCSTYRSPDRNIFGLHQAMQMVFQQICHVMLFWSKILINALKTGAIQKRKISFLNVQNLFFLAITLRPDRFLEAEFQNSSFLFQLCTLTSSVTWLLCICMFCRSRRMSSSLLDAGTPFTGDDILTVCRIYLRTCEQKRCESSFQKIVFYSVLSILHRENISFIIQNSTYKNEHKSV